MWLHTLNFGLILVVTAATDAPCNPKSCRKNTETGKNVCGSDGLTYPSRCFFEKARCANKDLTLVKRGPCRQQKLCRDWEIYRHADPNYKFQANCRTGDTYAAAQCHPDIGFCWCVSPQGLPLPYTSEVWKPGTKPHCGGKKKSNRRRSPSRKGRNRSCRQPDKAKFNNNLINIFHTEWSRQFGRSNPHNNDTDTTVKQWKFLTMDVNRDGVLDKNEYKDLKKVAKKAVKPKRCAKTFPRSCDVNSDTMISQQEWAECLTRDGMDDGGQSLSEDADSDGDYSDAISSQSLTPHVLVGPGYDEVSSEMRDSEDPTDCLSDRKAALLDGGQFYVPECTPDGRYKKIQCYKAAGYCFCVHEDTGKNIPGTSVKHGTPKCDQLTNINRPMKGCPDEKKTTFLRDLMHFLHGQMVEKNATKNLNHLQWMKSKEEQVATYTFVVYDKNKNKLLDRNEWKAFKEIVSGVKHLKKCGKKLPRYCDINKDRRISMTEWLDCLNVQQVPSTTSSSNLSPRPTSSRAGKRNPLDVLLED